ncbi:MAG TPA: hypothetical protein VJR03_08595 [Nitrospira sp.]|nr:hypothetical protein [Nitrospira sp.]
MLPTQHTQVPKPKRRPLMNRITAAGIVLFVAVMTVVLLSAGGAWADDGDSSGGSDDKGIQVGAWALTVPYIIAKGAFAAGGAVVGALGYVFSGGNERTAKAVWTRSIYGTYIIRPAHLRGEEAVRFLGPDSESQDESMPAYDQLPTQLPTKPVEPTNK